MARDKTQNDPQTILGGSLTSRVSDDTGNSNILIGTDKLRNSLISRNLYTPNLEYPNTDRNTVAKITNAVSGLIDVVAPFKSFNLENSVFGRVTGDKTPLTEIGSVMLAKQFVYNSKSHLAQQNLPIINVSNLFDGNKDTKLFSKNIDFKITKKRNDTLAQKFGTILDKVFFDVNSSNENPFDVGVTNSEYIQNTGEGQLGLLYSSINNNIYKSDDPTLIEYGDIVKKPIQPRSNLIALGLKSYFNFSDSRLNPYVKFHTTLFAEIPANQAMIKSYNITPDIQEYAPNNDYVINNFGRTENVEDFDLFGNFPNEWIDQANEFNDLDISNKLIWGKNGVSSEANEYLDKFRGDKNQVDNDFSANFEDGFFGEPFGELNYNKFGVRTGLLEYTRNLINATGGRIGDITRKAYTDENNKVGAFNGSALWVANNSVYAQKAGIANKKGVRQHSILDQYDRFSKAIRFNGNEVYNGNPDSVIYRSVMPRIHPTFPLNDDGIPNNKNLMFSIENLGIGVISKGDVGIIDDEWGSEIPICEVGPFNGRIMWFPPYSVQLNESAMAKYDTTALVGRNEPIYSYQHSERTATLSFSLLIDYPEHLRQFHNKEDQQRLIAEFFAFGGDPYTGISGTDNIDKRISELQKEIDSYENKDQEEPKPTLPNDLKLIFPDAIPRKLGDGQSGDDNVNTIIDKLYKTFTYEIIQGLPSNYSRYGIKDTTSWGLNRAFYVLSGVTEVGVNEYILDTNLLPSNFSQYNQTGDCLFNRWLRDFYSVEENREFFDIIVYGGASKLYTESDITDIQEGEAYNKELGLRRANTAIKFTQDRLAAIFETSFDNLGINITYGGKYNDGSNGDVDASQEGSTKAAFAKKNIKEERFAAITVRRNDKNPVKKKAQLSDEELRIINEKKKEIESLQTKLQGIKSRAYDCIYNERDSKTGILNGFKSVSGNYYSPVFHSQTPEDFHKRLTFLQQCTRQGAAKRYDNTTGNFSARNSVFGRQPICILRFGDFFHTKVVIDTITFDYNDTTWDMNPEGFGMQPMIANISIQMKVIGGQSLKAPIDALQNAASFNYYANSTFTNQGLYKRPSDIANSQEQYNKGILAEKKSALNKAYDDKFKNDNNK